MKFNQVVCMDLKQYKNKWIIYLTDVVTRYIRADFLENNCKETIVGKIIQLWLSIFGAANTCLMDNGGEFANDEMREFGNQYGINIKQTVAYNPWSNGLTKRNHATTDIMVKKYFLMLMKIQLFSILCLLGIVAFIFMDSQLLN